MTDIDPAAYRAAAAALAEACAVPNNTPDNRMSSRTHAAFLQSPKDSCLSHMLLELVENAERADHASDTGMRRDWKLVAQAVRLRLLVEAEQALDTECLEYYALAGVVWEWMAEVRHDAAGSQ